MFITSGWLSVLLVPILSFATVKVPANAHLNYFKTGWECNKGFKKSGSKCLKLTIPQNAKLDYIGNSWVCKKGFRKSNNSCTRVNIPLNAKLNYLGNNWECKKSYKKQGKKCIPVQIPKNGKLNYTGNGWTCKKGYKVSNKRCVKVVVPLNAKLNYLGNGWACNEGFIKKKSLCREMTKSELMDEIKRQRRIAYRASLDPCDKALESCKSACSTQLYNYDTGNYIRSSSTNFESECENACESGLNACNDTGKDDRCYDFNSSCDSDCPSAVTLFGDYLYSTDANNKCSEACSAGQSSCEF